MTPNIRRFSLIAALLPLGAIGAQTTEEPVTSSPDTPWAAFIGCWESSESATTGAAPLTCILPEASNPFAARILTIRGEETLRSSVLLANGTRVAIDDAQCTGWEAASFSDDGARLYLVGESRCGEAETVRMSGVYAILPNGAWLKVAGARTEAGEQLQISRSRLVSWYSMPKSVASEVMPLMRSADAARVSSARTLRIADIVEASGRVDAAVAEVWIAEVTLASTNRTFRVNAQELRALAAANIPERVIDMTVAAANPSHFVLGVSDAGSAATRAGSGGGAGIVTTPNRVANGFNNGFNNGFVTGAQCARFFAGLPMSPFGFGGLAGMPIGLNGALYDCMAFNGFGMYGVMGAFGPLGWAQNGMYRGYYNDYGRGPILVTVDRTRGGTAPPANNGRVVRGRGYSSGATPSGGTTATPRDATVRVREPSTSSGSGSRSSGGSSSGGSSSGSGSGSSGRTAKPRTP